MDGSRGSSIDNPYHYSFKVCSQNAFENNVIQKHSDSVYSSYFNSNVSEYNCDQCDRSFQNDSQLQLHIKEHVVCNTNGCKFAAHPKIISAHIRMQHRSGIFNKIKKLDNPEEVKKWLAERKRKYPTRENIEKQAKLNTAKIKRGEVIERDSSRFNKSFNVRNVNRRRKPRSKKQCINKTSMVTEKLLNSEECDKKNGELLGFGGTGFLYEEDTELGGNVDFHLSEEEESGVNRNAAAEELNPVNKSLALLIASYDSEEEFNLDTVMDNSVPVAESDGEAPDEVKNKVNDLQDDSQNLKRFPKKSTKRILNHKYSPPFKKRNLTLLEKLLEKQIVEERTSVLECARFITRNNFLLSTDNKLEREATHCNSPIKSLKEASTLHKIKKEISVKNNQKPGLLRGLLRNEIITEKNIALQCIRYTVQNNFMLKQPQ